MLTVNTADLLSALTVTSYVADGRMPDERLAYLLAHGDTLTVHAGAEQGNAITVDIDAKVGDAATAAVPHHVLSDIVAHSKSLKGADVTLDLTNADGVVLTIASFTASIKRVDAPTPPLVEIDDAPMLTTDLDRFRSLLGPEYAVDRNAWNSVLNGVYLDDEEGRLRCVGTDGVRLAYIEHDSGDEPTAVGALTGRSIPRAASTILRRALNAAGGDRVRLAITTNRAHLVVATDGDAPRVRARVALLDTPTYPAYRRILPTVTPEGTIVVKREALLDAARRVKALPRGDLRVTATVDVSDPNTLRLDASDDHIVSVERVPLERPAEAPLMAHVNSKYLIDALANLHSEVVEWYVGGRVTNLVGVGEDANRRAVIAQTKPPEAATVNG